MVTDFKCYFHLPFGISMIFYGCSSLIAHHDSLHTNMSNIANAKTRRKQQGTGSRSVIEIQISVKVVRIMDKCKSHPYNEVAVTDNKTLLDFPTPFHLLVLGGPK